jgi:hypothetical protein
VSIIVRLGFAAATIAVGLTTITTPAVFAALGPSSSSTSLTSSPNAAIVGDTVTFTATVMGGMSPPCSSVTPTGNVTFLDGGNPIGGVTPNPAMLTGGTATFSTNALQPVGTHSITASYSGDANCLGSTSEPPTIVTINPAPVVVPTLSAWAKIAFALLLLLAGAGFLARRARMTGTG